MIWALESCAIVEEPGRAPVIEGTCVDITDRKRAEEEIEHLAYHDALTGLPNRKCLQDHMELALAQAQRSGTKLAVLFLDLDRFKLVNDTMGHGVGDEVLAPGRRAPARLRARRRHRRPRRRRRVRAAARERREGERRVRSPARCSTRSPRPSSSRPTGSR